VSHHDSDLAAVSRGNVSPLLHAADRLTQLAKAAMPVQIERTKRLETLTDQAERDATELEALREQLEVTYRRIDVESERGATLQEELAAEKRENARLRRENGKVAQRAFYLQPHLRVKLPNGHEGVTLEAPVQASVVLDGQSVAVRVDSKHLRFVAAENPRTLRGAGNVTVDGVNIGTARDIRLTPLGANGAPIPYAIADRPEPDDGRRPPFHHERGNISDYLEALAEEIHNGPRSVERLSTVAEGSVLNVIIHFGVPPRRGELTDLLYVAEG
jgi:hypothetical protein